MGNSGSTASNKQHPPAHPAQHPSALSAPAPHAPPAGLAPGQPSRSSSQRAPQPAPVVSATASARLNEARKQKRSLEFPDFAPMTPAHHAAHAQQRRQPSFVASEPIPIPGVAPVSAYVRPVDPDSASMQDLVVPARPHPNRMPAPPLSPVQSREELHQSSDARGPRSKVRAAEYTQPEVVKSSVPLGLQTPEVTLGAREGANSQEVPTLVTWSGRGKDVWVEDTWNGRTRLTYNPETELFSETILLPVGNMSLKFIVDDELKLSPDLPMASDDDGSLVNYITVSPPVQFEPGSVDAPPSRDYHPPMWSASRWLKEPSDSYSSSGDGLSGSPPWTSEIPKHLVGAQAEEEAYNAHRALPADTRRSQPAPPVPIHPPAPTLPRHLDKVILSSRTPRATTPGKSGRSRGGSKSAKREREAAEAAAAGDDDAVLPVPSHVVLHHLGTSAIRDGVIAVADTVRYRKKYITTVYYKPMFTSTPETPVAA
ncbi:hypothetical protein AURDEDRAFT_182383 [Auricularia subglabra TFB-10046 SS5]|nr:hypothetical protein AURDEDRAFT_182383 [Auricularia subglabra TFB-10046 SS5]